MMFRISFFVLFSLTISLSGLAETPVRFPVQKIKVGQVELTAEIAKTEDQRARGLMFRKELKDGEGMLFVFENEQGLSFWMKNTFIPLSIGFFDSQKTLIDIQDMDPVASEMDQRPPSYKSRGPAKYALEVPRGWFHRKGLKKGAKLALP